MDFSRPVGGPAAGCGRGGLVPLNVHVLFLTLRGHETSSLSASFPSWIRDPWMLFSLVTVILVATFNRGAR